MDVYFPSQMDPSIPKKHLNLSHGQSKIPSASEGEKYTFIQISPRKNGGKVKKSYRIWFRMHVLSWGLLNHYETLFHQ